MTEKNLKITDKTSAGLCDALFDEPVLSDEEIDLHFAQYLAKQLKKTAREKA